ncbi:hypothetical protein RND71_014131 [Anisodus tanguticus]|uniref:Uncharacterized protein n=1 Tax=Anisodus tanguticus TaxID=243964 RepID=A0AAE1VJN5_9SOLA|nr:hypothetical protein RND71_014131 [Anisodus tanguticus]
MGRNIPLGEVHPIHHPLIYFSFMIACISATIAIFSSLCGFLSKKKSPPPPTSSNTRDNENQFVSTTSLNETSPRYDVSFKRNSTDQPQLQGEESISLQQPLPPPPSMRATSSNNSHLRANSMAPTTHLRSNSSSSQGRLSGSVSMRGFGGSLGSRQSSRREDSNYDKKRDKKSNKDEDSIWKKQIILGEKCKVPADEDDDTILYDEDGNRISAYHPKPSIGLIISRQSSNIEEDDIPK